MCRLAKNPTNFVSLRWILHNQCYHNLKTKNRITWLYLKISFQFQEYRISEVCDASEKLINDSHPEVNQINDRKNEVLEAWAKLKNLAASKQEKLYGAHEIQRWRHLSFKSFPWYKTKCVFSCKYIEFLVRSLQEIA